MQSDFLLIIAICLLVYALLSRPFGSTVLSAPAFFMVMGLAMGPALFNVIAIDIDNGLLELFAEFTLGLILFADASVIDTRKLMQRPGIPGRLLLLALPLTIAFGAVVSIWVFPELEWPQAALIATILAPTDAALGLAVVKSPKVPGRIRRAILVESGLNDGLALPAVLFFATLAFTMSGETTLTATAWLTFALSQIGLGLLVGVLLGGICGWIVSQANLRHLIDDHFQGLLAIAVALICIILADLIGGNSFISAFVAGIMFGHMQKEGAEPLVGFIEEEGQLLSLIIFFLFGAVLLPHAYEYFTVICILYAVLSLTVIRMIPTFLAMIGTNTTTGEKLFVGWFGPRGLASLLFLFIAVEHHEEVRLPSVEAVVYITVFLSVILHGVTANWFSGRLTAADGEAD